MSKNSANSGTLVDEPQLALQRLGAGSFATVYVQSGTRIAYKQVHRQDEGDTLKAEYETLDRLYTLCNSDSLFTIPRAIGFYDPLSDVFLTHQPPTSNSRRRRPRPAMMRTQLVAFESAVYAMERIHHLPPSLASKIASNFYPEEHRTQTGPRLCRLYFGKIIDVARPSRFFNANNFPLDVFRYTTLLEPEALEPVNNVAYEMGKMIGSIHWRGGYDARDIEFVMGGDGFQGQVLYVIDFNQMRPWSKTLADIAVLVDAHYSNDPYFPRARPTDPLYMAFKDGYLAAYPQDRECQEIANTFLEEIEMRQTLKDSPGTAEDGSVA